MIIKKKILIKTLKHITYPLKFNRITVDINELISILDNINESNYKQVQLDNKKIIIREQINRGFNKLILKVYSKVDNEMLKDDMIKERRKKAEEKTQAPIIFKSTLSHPEWVEKTEISRKIKAKKMKDGERAHDVKAYRIYTTTKKPLNKNQKIALERLSVILKKPAKKTIKEIQKMQSVIDTQLREKLKQKQNFEKYKSLPQFKQYLPMHPPKQPNKQPKKRTPKQLSQLELFANMPPPPKQLSQLENFILQSTLNGFGHVFLPKPSSASITFNSKPSSAPNFGKK